MKWSVRPEKGQIKWFGIISLPVRWVFSWSIGWCSSVMPVLLIWTGKADRKWCPSDPWICQHDPQQHYHQGHHLSDHIRSISDWLPLRYLYGQLPCYVPNLRLCKAVRRWLNPRVVLSGVSVTAEEGASCVFLCAVCTEGFFLVLSPQTCASCLYSTWKCWD